ncbi:MAG: hypothetical protein JWM89_3770 [Acidimicrobiales bacterium]|nr:hypothetical protein [Acidimicrobiales bacterium]
MSLLAAVSNLAIALFTLAIVFAAYVIQSMPVAWAFAFWALSRYSRRPAPRWLSTERWRTTNDRRDNS